MLCAAYSLAVPSRTHLFAALAKSQHTRERTAFYFGLSAFGRDFFGLSSYVSSRIFDLTEVQRKILGCLAMGHHYGQQAVRAMLRPGPCVAP